MCIQKVDTSWRFQSTPPARGATWFGCRRVRRKSISIHAPREGGDCRRRGFRPLLRYFNPRPPRGGRQRHLAGVKTSFTISIHAPREGGDGIEAVAQPAVDISIHAPREGGDTGNSGAASATGISIHAPREGGDAAEAKAIREEENISIHAPREGGDSIR